MTASTARPLDRAALAERDASDPLAGVRRRFSLRDGLIYLDGNSLGASQWAVAERVRRVVEEEWTEGLIRSWNTAGWVDLPGQVAGKLATLLGADADEVTVTDSTSANLFKAVVAARRARPDRRVILTDDRNFPSDLYVAGGVAELLADTELRIVSPDEIADHLGPDVAVLTMTHVDFRSGRLADAVGLTRAAHEAGALVVWDLSHSTGAVEVDLHGWDADLAVGCTYKYLNGGPGSPAYLYAARRLHEVLDSPVRGWFGHARPFDFSPDHEPAPDATRFLNGTAPVLSLAALDESLDAWSGVDVATATAKARALGDTFIRLVDERLDGYGVEVASPRDPEQRGAQVLLTHDEAYPIMQALIAEDVIGDVRPPRGLRFGFAPLYVRYVDVWDAVERLRIVLDEARWDRPEHRHRATVI